MTEQLDENERIGKILGQKKTYIGRKLQGLIHFRGFNTTMIRTMNKISLCRYIHIVARITLKSKI